MLINTIFKHNMENIAYTGDLAISAQCSPSLQFHILDSWFFLRVDHRERFLWWKLAGADQVNHCFEFGSFTPPMLSTLEINKVLQLEKHGFKHAY